MNPTGAAAGMDDQYAPFQAGAESHLTFSW